MFKSPKIAIGFWSETESDSALQVKRLPNVVTFSKPLVNDEKVMDADDRIAKNIHEELLPCLTSVKEKSIPSIDKFKYTKLSELTVAPRKDVTAEPINLIMYYVFSKELKDFYHFFLVDEKGQPVAYTRFAYHEKSPHLQKVYPNLPLIILDAIESKKRGIYSLGTVLVQAVFEHSLRSDCEGRIGLFSASKSGEFYFKLGFTPLNETIFDKLYFSGEKDVDGEVMFLTSAAIEAWNERASSTPLLADTKSQSSVLSI